MAELSDNEVAVLSLLVSKPLTYVPPRVSLMAEGLARRGLAVFDNGSWFVTAEGIHITQHTIH